MNFSRTTYEALGLRIFTVAALRLNGTSSTARRLEMGIVRLSDGKIVDRQEFSLPVPGHSHAGFPPGKKQIFHACRDWIGDDPIVIFGPGTVQQITEILIVSLSIPAVRILDAGELARIVFPWQEDFRAEQIARYLEIGWRADQSLVAEAEQTALVFLGLLPAILGLDPEILITLCRLLDAVPDGAGSFFMRVLALKKSAGFQGGVRLRHPARNSLGKPFLEESEETVPPVLPEEVNAFFAPQGPLSCLLPHYEQRKQQVAMARSVAVSLNQDEFLLAEAGTGVGKSLAYLVPAVLWTRKDRSRRVLIATHTKTLQDQLFRKEIPLLFEATGGAFHAVLLKGRSNYLCVRRWESLMSRTDSLSPDRRRALLPLVVWAAETRDGDIEENGAFSVDSSPSLWNQVNADDTQCLKSLCPYESHCHVQRARRAARSADLLVVNHALLFSDLVNTHTIMGAYDTLIVDEAHQFEKIATQHLGALFHMGHIIDLLQDIHAESKRSDTLLHRVDAFAARRASTDFFREIKELSEPVKGTVRAFREETAEYFRTVAETLKTRYPKEEKQKIRFRENPFQDWLAQETDALTKRLEHLAQQLSGLLQRILGEYGSAADAAVLEMEHVQLIDRLVALRRRIEHFHTSDYQDNVVWCEFDPKAQEDSIRFYSVPRDVSAILASQCYEALSRCVMTSATLTVGGRFDYMVSRLGLDRIEPERMLTQHFGSPFDYSEQATILFPTFLPSPKESGFVPEISRIIGRILETHHRGALVLFTSYQMLREVYGRIRASMDDAGFVLMAQGIDGPRSALLKRFREIPDSVLFGTNSFWEGVDVPGEALELLIITKIPFDVPTEPVFEARYEFIELTTGSGFLNYAVPEAIIRFRQGFGRLIRSESDRGAVLLLDRRAVSTQYGRLLIGSLPAEPVLPESEEALLSLLQEWFHGIPSNADRMST